MRQIDEQMDNNDNSITVNGKKIMLVYVVGGLTYLEIAALRTLSKHPKFPYYIIMATTKLISSNSLLTSLVSTSDHIIK